MADKEFKLGIVIDSSGAIKGIEDATGALVKFNQATDESADGLDKQGDSLDDTAGEADDYSDKMDTAFAATTALNQALEIATKIFSAVSGAIKETTAAYSVQEMAETGVANALKLTGQFTQSGLQGWKDWASALQNVTTTGDEATLEMVKTATALGLNEEQTKKAIKASLDLAAATGKNVDGTFRQLLQTYSGTATSLARLGIDTSALTAEQIKNGAAVDLVAKKFDGLAEAQTKTFTGASIQSANAYGDAVEEIGKLFVEVLDLAGSAQRWAKFWAESGAMISSVRVQMLQFKDAAAIVGESLVDLGKPLLQAIAITATLTAGIAALWIVVKLGPLNILAMAKAWLINFGAVMKNVAAHAVLAIKLIAVVAAIAAVVVAIDLLIRNWDNLSGLGAAAADGFALFFSKIESGFSKLIFKLRKSFRDFARSLGLDALADQLTKALGASAQKIKAMRKVKADMRKEFEGSLEGIDTGLAGEIPKMFEKISGAFSGGGGSGAIASTNQAIASATQSMTALGDSSVKAADKANKAKEKVKATAVEIAAAINGIKSDSEGVRIDVFGNSFEKAQENIKDTATAYAQAAAVFVEKGDVSAASVNKISTALKAVQTAEAQAKNLRIKTIEDVVKSNQSATIDLLKSSGEIVKAVEIENEIKLDALEKEHAAILKNLDLSDMEKKAITDQTKLLQEQNRVRLEEAGKKQEAAGESGGGGESGVETIQFADAGQLQALQDSFGAATSATVGAMSGAASAMMGAMTGIMAVMDIGSALMDAIISIPEKFTAFFNQLTDFGPKLAAAIQDLFKSVTRMISDLIPNLIDAITDILSSVGDFLAEGLPKAFDALAQKIPEALMRLFDKLPSIVKNIVLGVIRLVFTVIPKFITTLLKAVPLLITSFAKMIPEIVDGIIFGLVEGVEEVVNMFIELFINGGAIEIAKSITMAILNIPSIIGRGLVKVFKKLFSGIKIPMPELKVPKELTELPEKLKESIAGVGEGIKAGGGDVFALVDLAKNKSAKSIDRSIGEATKRAAKVFKETFQTIGGQLGKLWDKLREVWLWIWNNILNPIISAIKAVWIFIWEKILQPVIAAIQAVWQFFVDKILTPFIDGVQAIWDFFVDKILTPFIEGVQAVWDFFVDKILTPFAAGIQKVWDWFKTNILDKFSAGVQGVFNFFKEQILDKFASGVKEVFDAIPEQARLAAVKLSGAITKLPEQARQAAVKLSSSINALPGKATEFANNVITKLAGIGTTMWNSFTAAFGEMGGVIKNHATWAFDELFRNIKGAFGKIFEGVGGGGTGTIEGLMGTDIPILNFAQGGIVPGTATVPGNSIKNDTIAAFLSPDEAVIPRSIMAQAENRRIIEAMLSGELQFRHGWHPHKKSVPTVSAPKLPTINDVKNLSPADLAKNLESNFEALKKLATGDLWDMFRDKIFGKVKEMMESVVKNAAGFEDGGMVPNTGMAMVHQNEAVLPSGLVDSIMGNTTNNKQQSQNITLNATVNMVGADVAGGKQSGKKIIDEMFTELRKRSANQKIMFQSGLIA